MLPFSSRNKVNVTLNFFSSSVSRHRSTKQIFEEAVSYDAIFFTMDSSITRQASQDALADASTLRLSSFGPLTRMMTG